MISGMSQVHCQTLLCHDIVKSAPAYSLLAGTLAAVAFLAIIFLLEHSRRTAGEGPQAVDLENVGVSLISAFLNLIIATFLYAALSGEEFLTARAATMGFIAAIAISIAFLNLLYGVVWLFEAWELEVAASVTATIAGLVAPCVTFVFIGLRALDMLALAHGSHADRTWFWWLLASLLVGLILSFSLSVRTESARALVQDAAQRMGVKFFAFGAIALGVLTIIGAAIVSQLHISYSFPNWVAAFIVTAVFVVFASYAYLIRAIQGQAPTTIPLETTRALAPR
jgi:hypothetical protein